TPYARHATRRVVAAAVARGAIVLSGAARGVDGCAHRAALARGGFTVAVLGVGIDQVYPREHATLYTAIARQGCLVSRWGPGEGGLRGRRPDAPGPGARTVDERARAALAGPAEAAAALIELEWSGKAARAPGDRYRRRSD